MTQEPLTYAMAGGPPDDWLGLKGFDLATGLEIADVEECNAAEGWLVRAKTNERGEIYEDPANPGEIAKERIEGRFQIVRPNG